jgi:hypothetical protein
MNGSRRRAGLSANLEADEDRDEHIETRTSGHPSSVARSRARAGSAPAEDRGIRSRNCSASGRPRRTARMRSPIVLDQRDDIRRRSARAARRARTAAQGEPEQITLSGRSLLGVMFFVSLGVEPPPEHRSLVSRDDEPDFDWSQLTRGLLRIRSSNSEPGGTFVKVHYRGCWFYVADTDVASKTTVNLLTYLFSIQASSGKGLSPLLTVPPRGVSARASWESRGLLCSQRHVHTHCRCKS